MSTTTTTVGIRLQLEGANAVERGLAGVQSRVSDAAKALGGLAAGTLSAAAFTNWIKGAIDAADETGKLAQKTGLLTEQVAGLKLAFEQSGVGDQFGAVMVKLAKEASDGNKAFAEMGISVKDAGGKLKSTRDLLGEVADKFAGYADGSKKTALAVDLLGRSGADAIPLLNGGAQALEDFDKKAKALGLTISGDMAKQAEQFSDNIDLISRSASSAGISIANKMLPTLADLSTALVTAMQNGNGLLDVLRLFATTTYSTKGFDLSKDLKASRDELDALAKKRAGIFQNAKDRPWAAYNLKSAVSGIDEDIAGETRRRDYLKQLQAQFVGISRDDQSQAEARRLGLITTKVPAPRGGGGGGGGGAAAADRAAAAAARELAEQRKQDFDVVKQRNEAVQKAWEDEQEQIQKTIDAMAGLIEARSESAQRAQDALQAQREANEEYGLEGMALIELQNARLLDAAAALDRRAALAQDIDLSGAMAQSYREEADAMRALANARVTGERMREQRTEAERMRREYQKLWEGVEGFAENAFMDIALNGEDAFKRIGESLKREVIQLLYEMTLKKWIFQIAGVSSGAGGGSDWLSMAGKAYDWYTGGSAGSTAASAYSLAGGSSGGMGLSAGAAGAGGLTATGTGTGLTATAGTSTAAAGSTSAASGAAGASSGWMAAAGYAALIVAAVAIANNLYEKGYNRAAVGYGDAQRYKVGYVTYTADNRMGQTSIYDSSFERYKAKTLEGLGLSEKWVDILSGTTRMAALFGRKLSEVGFQANIAGGQVDVDGYAKYKGGLFRSNKTVGVDVDARDSEAVRQQIEAVREGSRAMARAMGLSSEAIDNYTGKLRINMKGAETAAEQSERMSKAMDNLQYSLLKAAAGGEYSRKEFEATMEQARTSMEAVGISAGGIADILVQGMTGRLSQADVGDQLANMIVGGIYNAIASQYAGVIAQAFTTQIITPIFTALAAGVPISQAISQAAINNVVATAQNAAAVLGAVFADPAFKAAIGGIETAIKGTAAASVTSAAHVKKFGGSVSKVAAAATQAKDEWVSLSDSIIDEIRRIRGVITEDDSRGYAYYAAQFAITTGRARAGNKDAADSLPELSQAMLTAAEASVKTLDELQLIRARAAQSLETTVGVLSQRYRFSLPSFDVGTDYVPADMVAMVHKGERIVPAAFNPLNSPETGVSAAIDRLNARFDRLVLAVNAVGVNTADAARVLKSVTYGDEAFNTAAA